MELRFYINPDTGQPHIADHHVDEQEVLDVLRKPIEEIRGRGDSVNALGQTRAGRYLKVIHVPDADGIGIFVITASDPHGTTGPCPEGTEEEKEPMSTKKPTKDPNRYRKDWNRRKVEAVIGYYDKQTDDEAIAEAEAAYRKRSSALVEIPVRLLPEVRRLLARRRLELLD